MSDRLKRLADKHSEFVLFMNKRASVVPMSDKALRDEVMQHYNSMSMKAEGMIVQSARANKDTFPMLDFRSKTVSKELIEYVDGFFEEYYAPQIIDLLKKLPGSDIKERGYIMQDIISIFEQKTPLQVFGEIVKSEQPREEPVVEDAQPQPRGPSRVGAFAKTFAKSFGVGAMMGMARQKTLLGAGIMGGAAAYGAAKYAASRVGGLRSETTSQPAGGFFSGMFSHKKPSQVDFTPREEQLEGKSSRTQELLEKIEENTRKGCAKSEEQKSNLLSTIGNVLGKIFKGPLGKIAGVIGSVLTFLKGFTILSTLVTVVKASIDILKWIASKSNIPNVLPALRQATRAVGGVASQALSKALPLATSTGARVLGGAGLMLHSEDAGDKAADDRIGNMGRKSDKIGALTRSLETGSTEGGYGTVTPDDRGQPSYGAYQFRKGSGLKTYLEFLGSDDRYKPILERLGGKKTDKEFQDAWKALASDPKLKQLFAESQDASWKKSYFDDAMKAIKKHGFKQDKMTMETVASLITNAPSRTKGAMWKVSKKEGFDKLSSAEQNLMLINELRADGKIADSRLNKTASFISDQISKDQAIAPTARQTAPASAPSKGKSTTAAPVVMNNTNNVSNTTHSPPPDPRAGSTPMSKFHDSRVMG